MTRSELIASLAEKNHHLTQADIEIIVKAILDEMGQHLSRGSRIEIRDFGAFTTNQRPARMGRNPKTGEIIPVPKKMVPHFKPGKELRERVENSNESR